ncbi:MAG TPA: PAS domain S-box protein [Longimicrobiaceae bacterium]|nr:PAS domain S-box protein [Longimicrobiaceae bacterium]
MNSRPDDASGTPSPRSNDTAAGLSDELLRSEARLRGLIDSSLDAIITADAHSNITGWNHHAERIFGWSAEEVIGKNLSETIIPPQYREAHARGVERYLASGEGPILNRRIEITGLNKNGKEIPVELTVAPARWGTQVVLSAFLRDISERKEAERRQAAEHAVTRVLAESHSLSEAFPRALQAIGDAFGWQVGALWLVDASASVLRCAEVWRADATTAQDFECSSKETPLERGEGLPGRVWDIRRAVWIRDAVEDPNFPRAEVAAKENLHAAVAFPISAGDVILGVIEFLHHEIAPPDEPLLEAMSSIGSGIGQAILRIRAEEGRDRALAEAERISAERDAILRQITDGVVFTDCEGKIIFVNEAAREIHGAADLGESLDDYAETNHLFTMDGEPYPNEDLPLSRSVRNEEVVRNAEWRIRRPGAEEVIAQGGATPVRSKDGKTLGAVLTLRDVTATYRLHQQLRVERARLREIFAQAPALISVTRGPEHRFELANPAYQRMLGGRELVGKTVREALPELAGQGYFEMRDTVYHTGEPNVRNEARIMADLDGDGEVEEYYMNFLTQPLRSPDGEVEALLTFAVDVSEQVRARERVEEQAAEIEAHAEELQDAQAELEAINEELHKTNEELTARTLEAERSRREAEEANRTKSDFLATMSHELRTPLNAMIGYTGLLLSGIPEAIPEASAKQVERIGMSARHLLQLIEEILAFSRMEAGREQVQIQDVQVAELVEEVAAIMEPLAGRENLEFSADAPGESVTLRTDPHKTTQILLNLIGNAIKFTEEGEIQLTTEIDDDSASFHVRDTGIGIDEEHLEKIFEPFWQAERGHTRTAGGTGLGLGVSRELARMLGGDLTVVSSLGEGSVFTLTLPAGGDG